MMNNMNNTINAVLDQALINRKRKRIAAAVLVPILLLPAVLVAFWTSRDALAAPPSTNPADYKLTVVYIEVGSSGWDWPYFVANKQVAYCADNDKAGPMPNAVPQGVSFDYSFAGNPEMLVKVLFYGYGGPGSPEFPTVNPSVTPATTAMKNRYAATTCNLHRSIYGSYYVADPDPTAQWNQIAAQPYPDFELAFTPASPASSIVTLPGDVQVKRSEAITLTGGPAGNSVKIPLAPGGNYSIRKGGTLYPPGTTAEIFVGESFFVEAPLNHSGTFNPGTLAGEKASKFTVIILYFPEEFRQRVITWKWDKQDIGLEVEFTSAPAELQLAASKTVNAGAPTPWTFDFGVYASDSTGTQGAQAGTAKSATDSAPGILFDPIQIPVPGTYHYLVKETSAGGSGWTADTTQYLVEATVADIAGTLTVTQRRTASRANATSAFGAWETCSDTTAAFHNTCEATPIAVTLKAAKNTTGGAMTAGQFSFTLSSTNHDLTSTPLLLQTKTNAAPGTNSAVTFDAIDYTATGTLYYLLRETSPGSGWTTDVTQYHIRVAVTDSGGALAAEVSTRYREGNAGAWSLWKTGYDADISSSWPAFSNHFSGFALKALKTAVGKEMEAGQFTFELYRLNLGSGESELLQQKTNLMGGFNSEVQFDMIPVSAPGTTYYMLTESSPGGGGWTANSQLYLFRAIASGSPLATALSYQAGPVNLVNIPGTWVAYTDGTPSTWPEFINSYYGIVFPETGGTGTTVFTITAIALTALLFLFFTRALIYRHLKRRRCLCAK